MNGPPRVFTREIRVARALFVGSLIRYVFVVALSLELADVGAVNEGTEHNDVACRARKQARDQTTN